MKKALVEQQLHLRSMKNTGPKAVERKKTAKKAMILRALVFMYPSYNPDLPFLRVRLAIRILGTIRAFAESSRAALKASDVVA